MLVKFRLTAAMVACLALASGSAAAADLTDSLKKGTPEVQSVGPLAFGPDGVLFFGDPQGAAVFAIDTGDRSPAGEGEITIDKLDEKIASLLGTDAKGVRINDLAVNPASGNVYLSVTRGQGRDAKPAILRVTRKGKIEEVELKDVKFSRVEIANPSEGGRRQEAITSMAFYKDRLIVAGLSNEEFASKLRVIPFPFQAADKGASVEIWHGAHGAFETRSPIRTFALFDIKGETNVLAAYTCTPLVKFPIEKIKPTDKGEKLKGTTIAELGNRNVPLDMIVYQKDGKDYILMSNSSRGIMKITTENIDKIEPITERISGGGTAGLKYETIEGWKGVVQMAKLDKGHAVIVQKNDDGSHSLKTQPLP